MSVSAIEAACLSMLENECNTDVCFIIDSYDDEKGIDLGRVLLFNLNAYIFLKSKLILKTKVWWDKRFRYRLSRIHVIWPYSSSSPSSLHALLDGNGSIAQNNLSNFWFFSIISCDRPVVQNFADRFIKFAVSMILCIVNIFLGIVLLKEILEW